MSDEQDIEKRIEDKATEYASGENEENRGIAFDSFEDGAYFGRKLERELVIKEVVNYLDEAITIFECLTDYRIVPRKVEEKFLKVSEKSE
jgi:hypothetical protein